MKPAISRIVTDAISSLAEAALSQTNRATTADKARVRALATRERLHNARERRIRAGQLLSRTARSISAAGATIAAVGVAAAAAGAPAPGIILTVAGAGAAAAAAPGWVKPHPPPPPPHIPIPTPLLPPTDPAATTVETITELERTLWTLVDASQRWPDISNIIVAALTPAADTCHALILTVRTIPPPQRSSKLEENLAVTAENYRRLVVAAHTAIAAAAETSTVSPSTSTPPSTLSTDDAVAELEGIRVYYNAHISAA